MGEESEYNEVKSKKAKVKRNSISILASVSIMNESDGFKSATPISDVISILALAVGNPTPDGLEKVRQFYLAADRRLTTIQANGMTAGCIGYEFLNKDTAIVHHIAVVPERRNRGVGRSLIEYICRHYEIKRLKAETDADAVSFYRACGFTAQSIGKNAFGVERFGCEWLRNS